MSNMLLLHWICATHYEYLRNQSFETIPNRNQEHRKTNRLTTTKSDNTDSAMACPLEANEKALNAKLDAEFDTVIDDFKTHVRPIVREGYSCTLQCYD